MLRTLRPRGISASRRSVDGTARDKSLSECVKMRLTASLVLVAYNRSFNGKSAAYWWVPLQGAEF